MSFTNRIIQLKDDLINICETHRCDNWRNSWMWDVTNSYIQYHYLIYVEDNHGLHYSDIEDVKIDLNYDKYHKKYRIDIQTRYKIHNFWLFDDDKWLFVEKYVKEIVKTQYNNIKKMNNLISLSNDAYFDREPIKTYKKMNFKLRKEKLKKINESR